MGQWIPWLPQFETGFMEIDYQHRELFGMFNELLDAAWDGEGQQALKYSLTFMADYVVNHFATEERYMRHHRFPGYEEHKQAHDDFTAEVGAFIREYKDKDLSGSLVVKVVSKLGDWTRDHVRGMDKELGAFLVEAEVAGAAGSGTRYAAA
ncbi:MAG: bacteriohemerythrin [Thermodesulfobacteriota bacterium]